MATKVEIVDPATRRKTLITDRNQLVVAPLDFDETSTQSLTIINTAFNFYGPIADKRFVITGAYLYADRIVGVNDATVEIYESTIGPDSIITSRCLFLFDMPKQTPRDFPSLNILSSTGVWISAKTNDINIFLTITGYYVKK